MVAVVHMSLLSSQIHYLVLPAEYEQKLSSLEKNYKKVLLAIKLRQVHPGNAELYSCSCLNFLVEMNHELLEGEVGLVYSSKWNSSSHLF